MTQLAADRNTQRADVERGVRSLGLAASQKIFGGAMVMRNASGYAVEASTALGLVGVGRAEEQVDNSSGSNGDKAIKVRFDTFRYGNSSAGDAITIADIGKVCYAVDDQTVAKTHGTNTRSPAGFIRDVDAIGVWVEFDEAKLGDYLANNKVYVQARVETLVGTNTYYALAPVAGRVTKIWSVIEGVLTTGDATLTAKIGATAITNGVLTVTQAGSAAGDVDVATPTALNVVAAGGTLAVTVGGTNATASKAQVVFEITRD